MSFVDTIRDAVRGTGVPTYRVSIRRFFNGHTTIAIRGIIRVPDGHVITNPQVHRVQQLFPNAVVTHEEHPPDGPAIIVDWPSQTTPLWLVTHRLNDGSHACSLPLSTGVMQQRLAELVAYQHVPHNMTTSIRVERVGAIPAAGQEAPPCT